jgi:threonine/homoserine/homoserine lactone efflux protein
LIATPIKNIDLDSLKRLILNWSMFSIYLRGLLIGITIAAPVGPVGLLCIRRTLVKGKLSGLVSGLGAASADSVYGIVAGFGFTFISKFLITQKSCLSILGALFLCVLGIKAFQSKPVESEIRTFKKGLSGDYFSTFLITITNPMTILSFTAVFASLGLSTTGEDYASAISLVAGVFSGSSLWWLTLSQSIALFKRFIGDQILIWINRISGLTILIIGFMVLVTN